MSETAAPFKRLISEATRKTFYAELTGPAWWLGGVKRSSTFGWVDVFEKSDGKCVYCSRDLAASTDAWPNQPRSISCRARCWMPSGCGLTMSTTGNGVRRQPSDKSSPQQPGTPQPLRQRLLSLAHPVAFALALEDWESGEAARLKVSSSQSPRLQRCCVALRAGLLLNVSSTGPRAESRTTSH